MWIAVSSWSFHTPLQTGELKLSQVPAACAVLGFEFVELNDVFLRPKSRVGRLRLSRGRSESEPPPPPDLTPPSLERLEGGLHAANARLVCLTADNDFVQEPQALEDQIRYVKAVIGAARYLNSNVVRLWLTLNPERIADVAEPTVDAFRQVTETAAKAGVRLALEHRFDHLEEIEAIIYVVEQVRSYHLGACLNFGRLPSDAWRVGLTQLVPYTIHAHARSRAFDAAGNETVASYPTCVATLQRAGYQGFVSIEYDGEDDPLDGIMATKTLIERCMGSEA